MNTAAYWTATMAGADEVIMTASEIEEYNEKLMNQGELGVIQIENHPRTAAGGEIRKMITRPCWPEYTGYINGAILPADYYQQLEWEMNVGAIGERIEVSYGFTVRRCNVRTFPTDDFMTRDPVDEDIDRFQDTALDPAEPIVVFRRSRSADWCFIRCQNYYGWCRVEDIALAEGYEEWKDYADTADYLVVAGNYLRLGINPRTPQLSGLQFAMGARLPLVRENQEMLNVDGQSIDGTYVVRLPVRDDAGRLQFKLTLVPRSAEVIKGYLPYTHKNILIQAFRTLGDRYGWGGLFGSRDCSALVLDVYRSFGFRLPRDAGEQAGVPGRELDFSGLNIKQRKNQLAGVSPGAMLHFPGHVMIYLGEREGKHYVIHAIAACGDENRPKSDGTLEKKLLNGIMVSDLSLRRMNGQTLLEAITVVKLIAPIGTKL